MHAHGNDPVTQIRALAERVSSRAGGVQVCKCREWSAAGQHLRAV